MVLRRPGRSQSPKDASSSMLVRIPCSAIGIRPVERGNAPRSRGRYRNSDIGTQSVRGRHLRHANAGQGPARKPFRSDPKGTGYQVIRRVAPRRPSGLHGCLGLRPALIPHPRRRATGGERGVGEHSGGGCGPVQVPQPRRVIPGSSHNVPSVRTERRPHDPPVASTKVSFSLAV
jgi:hypothetical protein